MGSVTGNHHSPFLTFSPVRAHGETLHWVLWAQGLDLSQIVFSKRLDGKGQESLGFKMVK